MVLPAKMELPALLDLLDFLDPLVPPEIRESLDPLELLDPLVPVEPLYVFTVSEQIIGNETLQMFDSSFLLFIRVSVVRLDQPDPLDSPDPLYVTASRHPKKVLVKHQNKIWIFLTSFFNFPITGC